MLRGARPSTCRRGGKLTSHLAHRYVVANDLSSSAVKDIKRNIEYNGLAPKGLPATTTTSKEGEVREPVPGEEAVAAAAEASKKKALSKLELEELTLGRVRANEGDAM